MGASRLIVICDAGPLIHLAEISGLSLLSIFETLHIPDAVWSETVERSRVSSEDLWKLNVVQRHALPQESIAQFVQTNRLANLHNGERECLYLCHKINIATLLTDDLAVRDAAKRLNLQPVGSLGVVVRAYKEGLISLIKAEQLMLELYTVSSLFVTKTIIDIAIQQLYK